MDERTALTEMWPLFGLAVRTPRLELRYPTDVDLVALAALTGDIHDPGFLPFCQPWSLAPEVERERGTLQFHWRSRAELTPTDWQVPLVAVVDGVVVGTQELLAKGFAVRRTVTSGSWLHRPRQGQGLGREMREAVLHLAFAGLGAARAETEAFDGNDSSMAVTRAVGYRPNGDFVHDGGELGARRGQRFVLERDAWERRRRDDIELHGVDACRPLLGA
jgi:RimJ/RimL family protein N-acetyltransferase